MNANKTKEIADILLAARETVGWTQLELEEATGVRRYLISQYETGRKRPTLKTAQRLAKGLGISLAEFDLK